jgi:anion-transporting  ArsA/GET3 family ATPase
MSLDHILEGSIVVCAGSGGVGKTTISAAIALEAAKRDLRTIVLTIDPAKRLASSLGLERLGNTPSRIEAVRFEAAGLAPAPLDAMMLDTKTAFDELVMTYAKDERKARTILNNRFYQAISGALSGTNEYMAMEKLYELHAKGDYDLIVIDTPPTRNALDFLEAPTRVTSFLEGRVLKYFLLPAIGGGKGIFKAFNVAAVSFLRIVKRIVGIQVLEDTAEFFQNFDGMYDGFKQRAQDVFDLLRQPESHFIVVTTPNEDAVAEAEFFASTLNSYELNLGGVVVNRVHPRFEINEPEKIAEVFPKLAEVAKGFERVATREDASLQRISSEISSKIPFMNKEVTDLEALNDVASWLFPDDSATTL